VTGEPSSRVIRNRAASSPGRVASSASTSKASSNRTAAWLANTICPVAPWTVTASDSAPRIRSRRRPVRLRALIS
jgi:hypothetical protein